MKMVRGYLHLPHKHAEGDSVTTVPHSAGRLPTRKFPAWLLHIHLQGKKKKKKCGGKRLLLYFLLGCIGCVAILSYMSHVQYP